MLVVHITSALSGEGFTAELNSRATTYDLKRHIQRHHGVRKSKVGILFRSTPLGNTDQLNDLSEVASWFFIADLVHVNAPRILAVSYVIGQPVCTACGELSAHYCGRCRAPYCSRFCQQRDWQNHKGNCIRCCKIPR